MTDPFALDPALLDALDTLFALTHTATVYEASASGRTPRAGLSDIAAEYYPANGAKPGPLQAEGEASDRVVLQGWHPDIPAKSRVVVNVWDQDRTFVINDVIPASGGRRTLLLVTPAD